VKSAAVKKPKPVLTTKRKRLQKKEYVSESDEHDNDEHDNDEHNKDFDDPDGWSDEDDPAPSPSPVKQKKSKPRKKSKTTHRTARKKLEVQPAGIDPGALTRSVLAEQDTALSMGAKLRKAIASLQVMFEWSACL
jgi:hypothetical protein